MVSFLTTSGLEYQARKLDFSPHNGALVFTTGGVSFYPHFRNNDEIFIAADDIVDIAISTDDTRSSRLTVTRLYFLRWLALALPKRTGSVTSTITIASPEKQVSFEVKDRSLSDIRTDLAPYLDAWGITLI